MGPNLTVEIIKVNRRSKKVISRKKIALLKISDPTNFNKVDQTFGSSLLNWSFSPKHDTLRAEILVKKRRNIQV